MSEKRTYQNVANNFKKYKEILKNETRKMQQNENAIVTKNNCDNPFQYRKTSSS